MDRHQAVERIRLAKVANHVRPSLPLPLGFRRPVPGQVERHRAFARRAPDDRQRSPPRDQVPPVLFHLLLAQPRQVIAPGTHHAGHQPLLDQLENAAVRQVKILRADAGVVGFPGEAGLVGAARVEGRHVRIQAGDDLNHGKALGTPVVGQLLKLVRPVQPVTEPHPPRVAEPEERRAVGVFKVPPVGRHADRAVPVQRVLAAIGLNVQRAFDAVQARILRITARGAPAMQARLRRRVTDFPDSRRRPRTRARSSPSRPAP